jgi:hypothetical protein
VRRPDAAAAVLCVTRTIVTPRKGKTDATCNPAALLFLSGDSKTVECLFKAFAKLSVAGSKTLISDDVTINANRKIISGSGSITDGADAFGFETVAFAVTRRGAASNLTVTFDDAAVHTYTLDLATGELAQTS